MTRLGSGREGHEAQVNARRLALQPVLGRVCSCTKPVTPHPMELLGAGKRQVSSARVKPLDTVPFQEGQTSWDVGRRHTRRPREGADTLSLPLRLHPGPEGPLRLGRADSPQGGPGKVCTAEPWGATMYTLGALSHASGPPGVHLKGRRTSPPSSSDLVTLALSLSSVLT